MTDCTGYRFHQARVGEEVCVRGNAYGRMILRGHRDEVACVPHQGCRLEVLAVAPSKNPEVQQLLPLDTITYIQARFLRIFRRDLFLLPTGREVKLKDLEGSKLRLLPPEISRPPREEDILRRTKARGKVPVTGTA